MSNATGHINSHQGRPGPVHFKCLLSRYRFLFAVTLLALSFLPVGGQKTTAGEVQETSAGQEQDPAGVSLINPDDYTSPGTMPEELITGLHFADTISVPVPSGSHRSGLYWQFSIGSLTGKSFEDGSAGVISLMMLSSYQINNWFSAGLAIGIDMLEYMALPLCVDFKLLLPVKRSYYPYLYTKSGYSLPARKTGETNFNKSEYFGGPVFGVGAGIFLPGREDFRWYIQAGYRYSELRMESKPAGGFKRELLYYYHRPELRLGVFFN